MNTFKLAQFKAKTNIEKKQGRTPRHYKTMRIGLVLAAMMFGGVFYGLATMHTPETEAIEPSSFNAGYLIDDSVFYDPNTMTVAEIQKLLDDKSPACDMWGTGLISGRKYPDGTWVPAGTTRAQYAKVMREKYGNTKYHDPPYVCINKYYENPETHQSLYETQGVATAGMKSAAQIIYDVAQEYSINPQVLLVMIKKESLVWGDNWPLKYEYNTVMGYGCPDNAPCNEAYYGFYNQVQKAAWQLKYYREHPTSYRYKSGQVNNIQYHPNTYCGTKQVYLENIATTSLYIYTPYTPNDAALRAYPGTGDGCSSYGNRNFYMFFREWFGSTYGEKFVPLETSRYFTTTTNVDRINPYTLDSTNDTVIEVNTTIMIDSKIKTRDGMCYRTRHNTENNIVSCIPEKYLTEVSFETEDILESEKYMIINSNSVKTYLRSDTEKETFYEPLIRKFTKKIAFLGKTYYLTEFDAALVDTVSASGFAEESLTPIEDYQLIDEYYLAETGSAKVDILTDSNSYTFTDGEVRNYKARFTLNNINYLQTEFDFSRNNINIAVKEDSLSNEANYIDFVNPRQLKLKNDCYRINAITGEIYDRLPKGMVIMFTTKTYINGSWYYRTQHNTENDLPYAIKADLLEEVR